MHQSQPGRVRPSYRKGLVDVVVRGVSKKKHKQQQRRRKHQAASSNAARVKAAVRGASDDEEVVAPAPTVIERPAEAAIPPPPRAALCTYGTFADDTASVFHLPSDLLLSPGARVSSDGGDDVNDNNEQGAEPPVWNEVPLQDAGDADTDADVDGDDATYDIIAVAEAAGAATRTRPSPRGPPETCIVC